MHGMHGCIDDSIPETVPCTRLHTSSVLLWGQACLLLGGRQRVKKAVGNKIPSRCSAEITLTLRMDESHAGKCR